jgi:xylose isomerase
MSHASPIKRTVAIGAFGPLVTRFVPGGYRPELAEESASARVSRVVEAIGDIIDGVELYYPYGVNEETVETVRSAVGDHDVYAVAIAHHPDPIFARGALSSPDDEVRGKALARTRAGIDVAASFGARVIVWPGVDGFNYPFQTAYRESWSRLLDALAEAAERCRSHGLELLLEPKESEPAMKIHLRDAPMALHVVSRLRAEGLGNVRVNMDWQNVILRGDSLAETASLLALEQALGHQHASAGWGANDDKNIVGSTFFMQTLELAVVLGELGYGDQGERLGFDLYPYTEDAAAAVRQSVRQWEFIEGVAARIDLGRLQQARAQKDAVAAFDAVYDALGA